MTDAQTSAPGVPEWTIADRLKKAREFRGIDQTALATETGIARTTISNYERGATKPSKANVKLIAMATGVDRYWLLLGVMPGTPDTPDEQAETSTKWENVRLLRAS